MKLVRVLNQRESQYGILSGTDIELLRGVPFDGITRRGVSVAANKVKFLAPSEPTKVVAVGLNYVDHARELGMDFPEEPVLFLKPPSAVIGPEETVLYPWASSRVDYEGELAVVIGKRAKDVEASRAGEYILGYTCANDITARDIQKRDRQWTRAKSFDTFCPLGPYIETELDASNVSVRTKVNGKVRQESSTAQMIFPVSDIIAFVTGVMTLEPGDVILTGTPPGVGELLDGDQVEVDIAGIGILRNIVRKAETPNDKEPH